MADRDKYCDSCNGGPYTEAELSYIIGYGYLCDSCLNDLRKSK